MFTEAEVCEFRQLAEDRMVDHCIVRAPVSTKDKTYNTETFKHEPTLGRIVYEGKCRIQAEGLQEANPNVGTADWTTLATRLDLPVLTSTEVFVGCNVEVTCARYEPALEGFRARIDAPHYKSDATARRLRCTAVAQ